MSNTNKYGIKYLNLKKYLDYQEYSTKKKKINKRGGSNLLITGDSYYERLKKISKEELDILETPTYLSGFNEKKSDDDMKKFDKLLESQLKKAETIQKEITAINKKEYLHNLGNNTKIDNERLQQDLDEIEMKADMLNKQIHDGLSENNIPVVRQEPDFRRAPVVRQEPDFKRESTRNNIIKLNL